MSVGLLGSSMASVSLSAAALGKPGHATIQAWIEVEQTPGASTFQGKILASEPFTGRYELVVERQGSAGHAATRQSGALTVEQGVATATSKVVHRQSSG